MNYKLGDILNNKETDQRVFIKNITEEIIPIGKIFCYELEPIGYSLPENANYFMTQTTLEKYFIKVNGGAEWIFIKLKMHMGL